MFQTPQVTEPFRFLENLTQKCENGALRRTKSEQIRKEGARLERSKMVRHDFDFSNSLFEELEAWEYQLTSIDREGLRCDDEPDGP